MSRACINGALDSRLSSLLSALLIAQCLHWLQPACLPGRQKSREHADEKPTAANDRHVVRQQLIRNFGNLIDGLGQQLHVTPFVRRVQNVVDVREEQSSERITQAHAEYANGNAVAEEDPHYLAVRCAE